MKTYNTFKIDFESYIREGEPDKKEKSIAWSIATGLQQVDGLTPSVFLYETAKRNIEVEISIEEARKLVDSYYESKTARAEDDDKEEADKVATRIVQILRDKTFDFSPAYYIHIHKKIFEDVFKFAGTIRDYNITKKEWILNSDTVYYADAYDIKEALDYVITKERNFDYSNLSTEEAVKHLTRFTSDIWQIHPFVEGNTRTTAIFIIKYLRFLHFIENTEPFEKHSWYFRNALVRANYDNFPKGIFKSFDYLEIFFRNVILNENNELKNRYIHIDYSRLKQKKNYWVNKTVLNSIVLNKRQ